MKNNYNNKLRPQKRKNINVMIGKNEDNNYK